MIGAVGWGTCASASFSAHPNLMYPSGSDLMGRSTAFNATLFFTALFGLTASFANSFTSLCIVLFLLGSAVGGSMPTDGTLLLEHMPKSKQYLVTALSVFFSFGAVLSAVVALLLLPQHSCAPAGSGASCHPDTQNQGWKYLLTALGLIVRANALVDMNLLTDTHPDADDVRRANGLLPPPRIPTISCPRRSPSRRSEIASTDLSL